MVMQIAFPQVADVRVAPERIVFEEWRQVGRTELFSEYRVSFPSAVQTDFPKNDSIELQVFLPASTFGRPPVVILLHFWGATDNHLERDTARELADRGIASVIVPLPFHLSRTPDGYRSGELAIVPDPNRLLQTMIQSVSDVRRTVDWIQTRPEFNSNEIGLTGTSLGAIVSSLTFAVEPRISAASFMLGGADLSYLLLNSSRTTVQRKVLSDEGWTEEKLRLVLAPIEPLNFLDPTDSRPTYLISARHDNVVPLESSLKLQAALGNPEFLLLETGHYGGFLVKDRLVRSIASFFDASLRGRSFNAPDKFYSPTIRFSVMMDTSTGLNLGAGLDIWRSNERADIFMAGYITPRGLRGYFGFQLGNGVSLGAMFSRSGTSPGLVWSTIF